MSEENKSPPDGSSNGKRFPLNAVSIAVLIGAIALLGYCSLPQFGGPGIDGRMMESLNNLKQVGTALKMYADDNEGRLPLTLDELAPKYVGSTKIFFAVYRDRKEQTHWIYYPGHRENDEVITASTYHNPSGRQKAVLVTSPAAWEDTWVILFSDFSAHRVETDYFKKLRITTP